MAPLPRNSASRRAHAAAAADTRPGDAPPVQYQAEPQQAPRPPVYRQTQPARFSVANTNRVVGQFRRDRNAGVITAKEWDEMVEAHEDTGRKFRGKFFLVMLLIVGLLVWFKFDTEVNVEVPLEMIAETTDADDKAGGLIVETSAEDLEKLEEHYKALGVTSRMKFTNDDQTKKIAEGEGSEAEENVTPMTREQRNKQTRLDNWRVKQELKKAKESHDESYGQLVSCGRQCEASHMQVQLAHDALSAKVERELYGVLLNENVKKTGRSTLPADELKAKYEAKKQEVEDAEKEGTDERAMALEELKDAYDILVNPQARTFYHLYGMKPPAYMKKTSNRDGGWGQDLMLRTFKNRLIMTWLDYFNSGWADFGVLAGIGVIGFIIPAVFQFPKILEMAQAIEDEQNRMAELEAAQRSGTR
jgi:hypothetical protein